MNYHHQIVCFLLSGPVIARTTEGGTGGYYSPGGGYVVGGGGGGYYGGGGYHGGSYYGGAQVYPYAGGGGGVYGLGGGGVYGSGGGYHYSRPFGRQAVLDGELGLAGEEQGGNPDAPISDGPADNLQQADKYYLVPIWPYYYYQRQDPSRWFPYPLNQQLHSPYVLSSIGQSPDPASSDSVNDDLVAEANADVEDAEDEKIVQDSSRREQTTGRTAADQKIFLEALAREVEPSAFASEEEPKSRRRRSADEQQEADSAERAKLAEALQLSLLLSQEAEEAAEDNEG